MKSMPSLPDVLTLTEAAAFLRVSETALQSVVDSGEIPARRIAGEWRILKAALTDWLRTRDKRALLLRQAGALVDDDSLPDLLQDIYGRRQRAQSSNAAEPRAKRVRSR